MLTSIHVPLLLRQLWALILAVSLTVVGAVLLAPDTPTPAPSLLMPVALLALIGIVGFGISSRLSPRARTLLMIAAAAVLVLACAGLAHAQAATDIDSGLVAPTQNTVITIDALTLSFLAGSVMPLLTSLATKLNASPTVKGVVNLVLSIIGGVLVAFTTNDGSLTYQEIAAAAIATYLSAQALYTGVLRRPAAAIAASVAPDAGVG